MLKRVNHSLQLWRAATLSEQGGAGSGIVEGPWGPALARRWLSGSMDVGSKSNQPSGPDVLERADRGIRIATLNRPRALNALNGKMIKALRKLYSGWNERAHVKAIVLEGAGRAFCAGGDVRNVYKLGKEGKQELARSFFHEEYNLNYELSRLEKPHVAILDGVTMGGGAGISIHGRFRVVTENAVFAMPETAIGLHPDVGASYFLSRLPCEIGTYLGLTGTRINGSEMVALGLATHYVSAETLPAMMARLVQLSSSDPAVVLSTLDFFKEDIQLDRSASVPARRKVIEDCFGHNSIEEIMAALKQRGEQPGSEWCQDAMKAMGKASPTSLKVTLRSIREAKEQSLATCLQREYRLSCAALAGHDFYEGVRALLVDKDNNPKWEPASLEEVSVAAVDKQFAPLPEGQELRLALLEKDQKELKQGTSQADSQQVASEPREKSKFSQSRL